jgi:hypothetical protein
MATKGGGGTDRQRTLIMVAIGLVLMGLLAFLLMARGGGGPLG